MEAGNQHHQNQHHQYYGMLDAAGMAPAELAAVAEELAKTSSKVRESVKRFVCCVEFSLGTAVVDSTAL